MVRCWIYSAGPDQCQCYNVDDENLADLAAQAQFLEDFRAQRAANPALYRQLLNMLVPAADAIPMRNYTPAVLTASPGSPPGLFLHPVTKSCSNLLLLFAFCSIMTVTKHEKEVSRYDYDSRLRPLDRASRRH